MKNFTFTDRAKKKIADQLTASGLSTPILGVVWTGLNYEKGEWIVGYYEKNQVSREGIALVGGVEIFTDPFDHSKLEGKTLDYVDNKFKVI